MMVLLLAELRYIHITETMIKIHKKGDEYMTLPLRAKLINMSFSFITECKNTRPQVFVQKHYITNINRVYHN